MKKIFILATAFLFLSTGLYSQNTYYIKGNAKILNPKYSLILKEDRKEYDSYYEIKIRIKDSVHTFTPVQVREYKHSTGKLYIAEKLPEDGSDVFMEVVEDGYLRLYFVIDKSFRHRFFIKKENRLMEITAEDRNRSNYKKVLRKNWDQCKKTRKLTDIAEFNRTSLKRTVRAHNTCKELYFPKFKFYAYAGIATVKPNFNFGKNVNSLAFEGVYRSFAYNYSVSYTGGIGVSIPIKQSDFSFEAGARIQAMKYNYITLFSLNMPFDREFLLDLSLVDISIPLNLQYTIPNLKYRPFFRAGLSPSFFISNESIVTERFLIFTAEPETIANEQLKTMGIGLDIAAGVQQQLNKKSELHLTIGYQRRGATQDNRIYNFTTFYSTLGYVF